MSSRRLAGYSRQIPPPRRPKCKRPTLGHLQMRKNQKNPEHMLGRFERFNATYCPKNIRHYRQKGTQQIHEPFDTSRRMLHTPITKGIRFIHPKRTPMEKRYLENVLSQPYQRCQRPKQDYQLQIRISTSHKLTNKLTSKL